MRRSGILVSAEREAYSQAFGSFIKLCRATWTVTARVAACLPGNITFAQFAVLEALHSLGPMYQRDLSQRILRSSAGVTAAVDGLERGGFVVGLTAEGDEFMKEVLPVYMSKVREEFSVLSREEQEELGRLCRTLGRGSEERI